MKRFSALLCALIMSVHYALSTNVCYVFRWLYCLAVPRHHRRLADLGVAEDDHLELPLRNLLLRVRHPQLDSVQDTEWQQKVPHS